MADLNGDFEFLVATVRRSIAQLEACTDTHAVATGKNRPTRGAGLREHIDETIAVISARVDDSERRFNAAHQDIERESVIDSLRLLNRIAASVHEAAGWLNAAENPGVHIGVLYFADEAAAAIVGADTDVIPVGDPAYQYATISWPFAPILSRLKGAPTTATRPVVVFFPPQEHETVLLHALFVHELAHSAVSEHRLVEKLLTQCNSDPKFGVESGKMVDLLRGRGFDSAEAQIRLTDQLRSWLTEALCDAIASEYLGPTYLLAFAAVVLATSWSEPSETHPPTTLRVRAMLAALGSRGWRQRLESDIPKTAEWLDGVGALDPQASSPLEQFLIAWTTGLADDIDAAARSLLKSQAYPPSDFDSVREEVAQLLARQILPSQLRNGAAIDRRAILLAGWLQVFELYDDSPGRISEGVANDEFQDFLGTAMEMSTVLETWKSL